MSSTEDGGSASSTSAFVSSLIFYGVIGSIIYLVFASMRPKQPAVYAPKSLELATTDAEERPPPVPSGFFAWFTFLAGKSQTFFVHYCGVDGYLFTRYVGIFSVVSLIGCFMLLPILLPVNATNGQSLDGFELLGFANVTNHNRYYAHAFLSWFYFGFIIYMIFRELVFYTGFRHAFQTTPLYDGLLSSRTLLLTNIDSEFMTEDALREKFPYINRIWYAKDHGDLSKLVKERSKVSAKYEGAANSVINKGVKYHNKLVKKEKPLPNNARGYIKKEPTHKLGKIPFIGEKVNTIDYSISRLDTLNSEIESAQDEGAIASAKQLNCVFIEFANQLEAQRAYQASVYLNFKGRFIGIAPDDVVWENLELSASSKRLKRIGANTLLTLMIIFWAIPVAVVGCISNITFLTEKVPFLRFINNCPSVLLGLITGILPTVLLSILMSLVPVFIKFAGKKSGAVSKQELELYCQSWYFGFQVIQVFLVMTLSSAATSTVSAIINDPGSAMTLLAQNLPKASNFYISYFLLQGLMTPVLSLLRAVPLLLSHALKFLQNTPRKKWTAANVLSAPSWGVIYPPTELLVVLFVVYSIISPILLVFSTFTMALLYVAYLYLMTYVNGKDHDMRGRNYPKALFQTFVGLYLAEICNLGLFIMAKAWGPLVLSVVILVVTVLSHLYFRYRFESLFDTVPLSAIHIARGDTSYDSSLYAKDQGKKEVETTGKNYLEDNLNPPDEVKEATAGDNQTFSSTAGTALSGTKEGGVGAGRANFSEGEDGIQSDRPEAASTSFSSRMMYFLHPLKSFSFNSLRSELPSIFNLTVSYSSTYLQTAYEDPCIRDEAPNIWVPKDPVGISEYQVSKAENTSVKIFDGHTSYEESGADYDVTGPPPSYEQAVKA
ncbi:hypothetical protein WICPIJ_005761 [Wickerhamomyces pijperi]|uniref:DUF221-domain-containing protein n=1 Tax=Wickerhamomyces pijperi TaxID=599730 RepID=A0A9P8Q3A3_WICPI|nr:hypothetical protein WICPIJ_005761 [Wickerhamomyces pijperi]